MTIVRRAINQFHTIAGGKKYEPVNRYIFTQFAQKVRAVYALPRTQVAKLPRLLEAKNDSADLFHVFSRRQDRPAPEPLARILSPGITLQNALTNVRELS